MRSKRPATSQTMTTSRRRARATTLGKAKGAVNDLRDKADDVLDSAKDKVDDARDKH